MRTALGSLGRCDGVNRREVLRIGTLTALGLSAGAWPAWRSASGGTLPVRARSCILVWLDGGPSHLETFDPKPEAPAEVRGPFGTIATAIPGVRISELLPETARRLDRVALLRASTSPLGEHNLGSHYLLTGYAPTPALAYPSYGAVVAHLRGGREALPPYVAVPDIKEAGGAGYLPTACAPFAIGGDPARPDFGVRDLDYYPGMNGLRLERRRAYLEALDRQGRGRATRPLGRGMIPTSSRRIASSPRPGPARVRPLGRGGAGPRSLRPEDARPGPAAGAAARRARRPVRDGEQPRMGHARESVHAIEGGVHGGQGGRRADPHARPRPLRPCSTTSAIAASSTRRWWWSWASSAGLPS